MIKAGETKEIFDAIENHKDERIKFALLHVLKVQKDERTIEELANRGYRVLDINEVQTERLKLSLDEPGKWVIKTKGSELSRGHGGLHSMVLPLARG